MSATQSTGWDLPGSGFKWDNGPGQEAALAAARGDKSVPSRFQTFDAPQVRPGRTFARSAVEAGLDAAALPVVAASRAVDYFTGRDSSMSNLSGKDAAESLEYLYDRTEPAQIRREEAFAEGEIPQAQSSGKFVGEYAGSAPVAALTGRVPAFSPIMRAAAQKTGNPDASAEPPIPAWALQKPKAPEYRTPAAVRAKAVAAHKIIAEHPDAPALRDYMMSGYDALNRQLRETAQRGHPAPVFVEKQAQKIEKVLGAVKDAGLTHNGATMRGLQLPTGTADKWIQSGAVTNKSFWSTSHNPDVADSFRGYSIKPGHEKVLLKLDQRSGVPVAGPEDEILHPRNKHWIVKDHEVLDDGTRVIELKEVPRLPPGVNPELSYDMSRTDASESRAV